MLRRSDEDGEGAARIMMGDEAVFTAVFIYYQAVLLEAFLKQYHYYYLVVVELVLFLLGAEIG